MNLLDASGKVSVKQFYFTYLLAGGDIISELDYYKFPANDMKNFDLINQRMLSHTALKNTSPPVTGGAPLSKKGEHISYFI